MKKKRQAAAAPSTAPRFLIVSEPLDYTIHIDKRKVARVSGDLTTPEGIEAFKIILIGMDERFSRGDGPAAAQTAVDELAAGQPIAGTTANELRETIQVIADEAVEIPKVKREARKPKALSFVAKMGMMDVGGWE